MPKVSVIVNARNAEKYLREALDSIYSQTFQNWEIIFVDDCSADNTAEIALSYDKKLKYYRTEKCFGLGSARSCGLKFCKGDYIAFLDADDLWLPDKLEIQLAELNSTDYAISYSGVYIINETGDIINSHVPRNEPGYNFANLLRDYEINMQTVVIRRSLLKNLSLPDFNSSYYYSPDYDLFMRLAACFEIIPIKKILAKYRVNPESLTAKLSIEQRLNEKELIVKNLEKSFPDLREKYKNDFLHCYLDIARLKSY